MTDAEMEAKVLILREKLGETIPTDGVETDSLFSNKQLERWITSTSDMNSAALEGWSVKMAHFANLVDVTDGAASRKLSDLLENAYRMVTMYTRLAKGPVAGRARVGKISRS